MMVVFRWNGSNGTSWREFVSTNGGVGLFGSLTPSNTFTLSVDNSTGAASFNPTANTWYFASWTKLSGTQTPYYNVYNYTTATWSTFNHGGTMANGAQAISNFYLGSYQGGIEHWPGDIAAVGFFRHWLPSNAAIQAMGVHSSVNNWSTAAAASDVAAWWVFNQANPATQLTDSTGGGANETTSNVGAYVAPPAGFNETIGGGTTATPTVVALSVSTFPPPTARASITATPAVVATQATTPGFTSLPLLDENGNPLLHENGDPILLDGTGAILVVSSAQPAPTALSVSLAGTTASGGAAANATPAAVTLSASAPTATASVTVTKTSTTVAATAAAPTVGVSAASTVA